MAASMSTLVAPPTLSRGGCSVRRLGIKAQTNNSYSTTTHILSSNARIVLPSPPPPPPPTCKQHHSPLALTNTSSPLSIPCGKTSTSITTPIFLLVSALTPLLSLCLCGGALAATSDSIRASKIGLRVATALRGTGWPNEAIVFALASLPVLELRGAIPVGYWMQLHPLLLTALSILGNMLPVPFILLYLKKLESVLAGKNAGKLLDVLLRRAREKAGPVKEFQWLGLMLFVAVPFPGTGAWTGAIVASVLDMPFWTAVSANFVGVVLAGLLVNLLVNLGLKYAIVVGLLLFVVSTFMWNALRQFKVPPSES